MKATIMTLRDGNNNPVAPRTSANAVITGSGISVETALQQISQGGGVAELPDNLVYMKEDGEEVTLQSEAVLKSGDTMTGALTLHADPIEPLHAATKQYVDNAIGGGNFELLWTNPNPTADFAAQTVSILASKYQFLLISFVFYQATGADTVYSSTVVPVGCKNIISTSTNFREFKTSSTSVQFFDGRLEGSATSYNNKLQPYQIYGIK
jgi:hypothetical protein